jgi:hypothetical protein
VENNPTRPALRVNISGRFNVFNRRGRFTVFKDARLWARIRSRAFTNGSSP